MLRKIRRKLKCRWQRLQEPGLKVALLSTPGMSVIAQLSTTAHAQWPVSTTLSFCLFTDFKDYLVAMIAIEAQKRSLNLQTVKQIKIPVLNSTNRER